MEFGPRALGARSILGDPRSPTMQRSSISRSNTARASGPFAPSVLREDVADWFDLDSDSPYMLLVADVRNDRRRAMTAEEQALFGIDKLNVARSTFRPSPMSTIRRASRPCTPRPIRASTRLLAVQAQTGCPVLVNTSFNVRGEPIVCTPEDAFRCFMGNELDLLVVGNCILQKTTQDAALKRDYSSAFEAD